MEETTFDIFSGTRQKRPVVRGCDRSCQRSPTDGTNRNNNSRHLFHLLCSSPQNSCQDRHAEKTRTSATDEERWRCTGIHGGVLQMTRFNTVVWNHFRGSNPRRLT